MPPSTSSPPPRSSRAVAASAVAIAVVLAGCSQRSITGSPRSIDPEVISGSGGTDEIYRVAQDTVLRFRDCLAKGSRFPGDGPIRVILDRIDNETGLADYDELVFYNRLLSDLVEHAGDRFRFIDRRSRVSPGSGDALLSIELRNLRGASSRTIQYHVELRRTDGEILCTHTDEFTKRT